MQIWIHGGRQDMKTEAKSGRAKNSLLRVHEEGIYGNSWDDLGSNLAWLEAS